MSEASSPLPWAALYGPDADLAGHSGPLRFCLAADDGSGTARLGRGELAVELTDARMVGGPPRASIYREVVLGTSDEAEALRLLPAALVDVALALVPASSLPRRVIKAGRVALEHGSEVGQVLAREYEVQAHVAQVRVQWDARTVQGSSRLCLDMPDLALGKDLPGVSVQGNYQVFHDGPARVENAVISLPWLSLAGAERRELQRRAAGWAATVSEPSSRDAIQAVEAVLMGHTGERPGVLRCLAGHPLVPPEIRALCATLLGRMPDREALRQLDVTARHDADPAVRAAAAVAVSQGGRNRDVFRQWIDLFRDRGQVPELAELFRLAAAVEPRLEVIGAMRSVPEPEAFQWLVERIRDVEVAPALRIEILETFGDDSQRISGDRRLSRVAEACRHVITYERAADSENLRDACFDRLAGLPGRAAPDLIERLYELRGQADRCLALTLLLNDGPRSALEPTLQTLVVDLLALSEADQQEVIRCATATSTERSRRLKPPLRAALAGGAHEASRVHVALEWAGSEDPVPLLFEVARSVTDPRVRTDILHHLLTRLAPRSGSPAAFKLFSDLLREALATCEGEGCHQVLGVAFADLDAPTIARILFVLVVDEHLGVPIRARALVAMARLGDAQRDRGFQAVVRLATRGALSKRKLAVEVIAEARIPDLAELAISTLCAHATDTAQPSQDRATSSWGLERLASARQARACLAAGFEAGRSRARVLANVELFQALHSVELERWAASTLADWLADDDGPSDLAPTAFAGLSALAEKPLAIETLAARLERISRPAALSLARAFATHDDGVVVRSLLADHVIRSRRLAVRGSWVLLGLLGAVACVGLVQRRRTMGDEDCCADLRARVKTGLLQGLGGSLLLVLVLATPNFLTVSQVLASAWFLTWGNALALIAAGATFGSLVWQTARLWPEGRPGHGTVGEFLAREASVKGWSLEIPASPNPIFLARGDLESYRKEIPNPERKKYPEEWAAWKARYARWENTTRPAWQREVARRQRQYARERAAESGVTQGVLSGVLGGVGTGVGFAFGGPLGAALGGLVGAAVPFAPSGPVLPPEPPAPPEPPRPPDTLTVTRTRPGTAARGFFTLEDGETVEVRLCEAEVHVATDSTAILVLGAMGDSLLRPRDLEAGAGRREGRAVPLRHRLQAAPFRVRITSTRQGVWRVPGEHGARPGALDPQAQLDLEQVRELRLEGDVVLRPDRSLDLAAGHVSGRMFFRGRSCLPHARPFSPLPGGCS